MKTNLYYSLKELFKLNPNIKYHIEKESETSFYGLNLSDKSKIRINAKEIEDYNICKKYIKGFKSEKNNIG